VRQGWNVSLLLFNAYIEQDINEYKEYCTGIKVNGTRIQILKFAYDIAIIAQDKIDLKRAFKKSNYKIKINRKKYRIYGLLQRT
jgi:hypothetical protein